MARKSCECTFLNAGSFWYSYVNDNAKRLTEFGNILSATVSFEVQEIEMDNKQARGGGKCKKVTRIDSASLSLTLGNLCPSTFAIGMDGLLTQVASAPVVGETHEAYGDSLIPFVNIPDLSDLATAAPVVESNPPGTTYVINDDYALDPIGIVVVSAADGGTIPEATPGTDNVTVGYTSVEQTRIEVLRQSKRELRVVLSGDNESQEKGGNRWDFKRVAPELFDNLPLIAEDDFANPTLTAEILSTGLSDPTISNLLSIALTSSNA